MRNANSGHNTVPDPQRPSTAGPRKQTESVERGQTLLRRRQPGPSGSEWALLVRDHQNWWRLDTCGYKYQGPSETNNFAELEALREGMAVTLQGTNNEHTDLHIREAAT